MKMEIKDIRLRISDKEFVSIEFQDGNLLNTQEIDRVNELAKELLELGVDSVIAVRK